jgi:hypothetical protein
MTFKQSPEQSILSSSSPEESSLIFYGAPDISKVTIESIEWRDLLAAAVREFDRATGAIPFACPECGKEPSSGSMTVDSNLTPKYAELFDDSGQFPETLIGMKRDRPSTTRIEFRCGCGCVGNVIYYSAPKGSRG